MQVSFYLSVGTVRNTYIHSYAPLHVCLYIRMSIFKVVCLGKLLDISLPDQTVKRQNGEV